MNDKLKTNEYKIMRLGYVDFVPNKYVENNKIDGNCIYIFSRRNGKRINKKKYRCVGLVVWCIDTKKYCYLTPCQSIPISNNTLQIIYRFIESINKKEIKFDTTEGEFVND